MTVAGGVPAAVGTSWVQRQDAFTTTLGMSVLQQLALGDPGAVRRLLRQHPDWADLLADHPPNPQTVHDWWTGPSGDPAVPAALIAGAPMIIGSLGGVPPSDRVAANRLNAQTRVAQIDRILASEPHPYQPLTDDEIAKLEAERIYLQAAADGTIQLYYYDQATDSIIQMIGNLAPTTTEINTYVPGTYTSAVNVYGGDVQQVGEWLQNRSRGSAVTFVWKVGDFPGENSITGDVDVTRILEANDEQAASRAGERLAAFQTEMRIAVGTTTADYNAIGHSWGLVPITASEMVGAEYADVASLAGAGMPSKWEAQGGTDYQHFSYTDALSMAQTSRMVWNGNNPGTDPAFESHIYPHEGDYTMYVSSAPSSRGVIMNPTPPIEIAANRDPIYTHNLIPSDDLANARALEDLYESVQ